MIQIEHILFGKNHPGLNGAAFMLVPGLLLGFIFIWIWG